jgi:hypothetical protein
MSFIVGGAVDDGHPEELASPADFAIAPAWHGPNDSQGAHPADGTFGHPINRQGLSATTSRLAAPRPRWVSSRSSRSTRPATHRDQAVATEPPNHITHFDAKQSGGEL